MPLPSPERLSAAIGFGGRGYMQAGFIKGGNWVGGNLRDIPQMILGGRVGKDIINAGWRRA